MNEQLEKLSDDIQIDEYMLEKECMNQPHLYAEIGALYVVAKTDAKRLKEQADYVKASLNAKIRSSPVDFGIAKPTEAAISAAVSTQDECCNAISNYIDAQEIADHFQILLAAADQRRSMLNDLVELWKNNYYDEVVNNRAVETPDEDIEKRIIEARKLKHEKNK